MPSKTYVENFDNGPGGWLLWLAGGGGPLPMDIRDGAIVSRSPWGIDFNHSEPGAGYCHLLFCLPTVPADKYPYARLEPYTGKNRFVHEGYSRNLTNAKITVRLKGEVDLKGAQLVLLVQGDVGAIRPNWTLTSQPLSITKDWSEQTLTLVPDESKWVCMDTRGEGADTPNYGVAPLADLLKDVNVNIIFILFPLDVKPFSRNDVTLKDRAGKDYSVDRIRLPSGEVWMDTIKIEYAE